MGELIEVDFGHPDDDRNRLLRGKRAIQFAFLAGLWRGLGTLGVSHLQRGLAVGSALREEVRQERFERQHSHIPSLQLARRHDLLQMHIQEQHGLLHPTQRELYETIATEFPAGPRGEEHQAVIGTLD